MGYTGRLYDIAAVARRLGQDKNGCRDRSRRWQITYITQLVAQAGFPAPLPVMVGEELTDRVTSASRWPVDAVEAWFDDRSPAGPAAGGERGAERRAAYDMDAAAEAVAASMHSHRARAAGIVGVVAGGRA